MSPESCDGGEGLRREERALHFCDATSACRPMSYMVQVELGGYIAWEGREHSMTITVAVGIASAETRDLVGHGLVPLPPFAKEGSMVDTRCPKRSPEHALVVFQINPAPQDTYCEACYEHRSW
jgi:hypothetical protein